MTPLSWHGARVWLGQTMGSGRWEVLLGPAPLPCPKAEHCLCPGWGCRYLTLTGFGGISPEYCFWPLAPLLGLCQQKPAQALGLELLPGARHGEHPGEGCLSEAGGESPCPAPSKALLHARFTAGCGASGISAGRDGVQSLCWIAHPDTRHVPR